MILTKNQWALQEAAPGLTDDELASLPDEGIRGAIEKLLREKRVGPAYAELIRIQEKVQDNKRKALHGFGVLADRDRIILASIRWDILLLTITTQMDWLRRMVKVVQDELSAAGQSVSAAAVRRDAA